MPQIYEFSLFIKMHNSGISPTINLAGKNIHGIGGGNWPIYTYIHLFSILSLQTQY